MLREKGFKKRIFFILLILPIIFSFTFVSAQEECNDVEGPVVSNVKIIPPKNNGDFNVTADVSDDCSDIDYAEYFTHYHLPAKCGEIGSGEEMEINGNELFKSNAYNGHDGLNWLCVQAMDSTEKVGGCECVYFETDPNPPEIVRDFSLNGMPNPKELLVCGENPELEVTICDGETDIQGGEYFLDLWSPPMNVPEPFTGYWLEPLNHYKDVNGFFCSDLSDWIDLTELEEGTHYINQIRGKDQLENWGKVYDQNFNYSFIKDTLPPNSSKEINFEGPYFECEIDKANDIYITDNCYYVRKGTTISLIPGQDPDPQGTGEFAGEETIHYNIYLGDDCDSNNKEDWELIDSGEGNPEQNVELNLNEDSCHLIEWWVEDKCGNQEEKHYKLDIVDNKAPVTEKTVGDPKIECEENCHYYITQNTDITFTCYDQEPHPIDEVEMVIKAYWKEDWEDEFELAHEWTIKENEWTITPHKDSIHKFEWYCKDKLNNTSQIKEEIDVVDTQAPILEKDVMNPKIPFENEPEDEIDYDWFVTQNTLICLNGTDLGPHPVNGVEIFCEWTWFNSAGEGSKDVFSLNDSGCFKFTEDSFHLLHCWANDSLGNTNELYEWDIVDTQKPISYKEVSEPKVPFCSFDAEDWYITNETEISLSCEDTGEHPVGADSIFYRVRWKYGFNDNWSEWGDWIEYNGTFRLDESSFHEIEWYCVDRLENQEESQFELDVVDLTPPEISKEIGSPKFECNIEGCDWFVTTETPLTFRCEDTGVHPVGDEKIYLESYLFVEDEWKLMGEVTGDDELIFNFGEESLHKIKYWCEDGLGNMGEIYEEIDNVDGSGPNIWIYNPTMLESESIKRCDQSIVVEVWDEKSEINDSSVYAELINESGDVVRRVDLQKAVYHGMEWGGNIYEALMDKQLPAGTYELIVYASDNVGHSNNESRIEDLQEGIWVEYLEPVSCVIEAGETKECIFTFNVCGRGINLIDFCMYKLGENPSLITPDMLNAKISKNGNSSYVGLCEVSDKEQLRLSDEEINGKETFDLTLEFNEHTTSVLGTGNYDIDYLIDAWD